VEPVSGQINLCWAIAATGDDEGKRLVVLIAANHNLLKLFRNMATATRAGSSK